MKSYNRLKHYIEGDWIYQDYKNGKLNKLSDFDKFCITHIEDIQELLNEVDALQNNIDKTIEYINSQSPDAGVSGYHIKKILKGNKDE